VTQDVVVPAEGAVRARVEVLQGDIVRTVTGHVWVRAPPEGAVGGCGCGQASPSPVSVVWAVVPLLLLLRRRPGVDDREHLSARERLSM
jgi:uncharacterized protein (TIGR03382 family)